MCARRPLTLPCARFTAGRTDARAHRIVAARADLNQWWITAGVRLSRNDFIGDAYAYVLRHWYNPATAAGVVQQPLGMRHENCIFTSAHLGFTMLHMGDVEKALAVGDTIVAMVAKQPHLDDGTLTYYNRFDDHYNLLTGDGIARQRCEAWWSPADALPSRRAGFAPDDDGVKLAAIVDGKEPAQCWRAPHALTHRRPALLLTRRPCRRSAPCCAGGRSATPPPSSHTSTRARTTRCT